MRIPDEKEQHPQCSNQILRCKTHSHRPFFRCLFSRIPILTSLILITFLLCLIQECSYILKFHTYTSTPGSMSEGDAIVKMLRHKKTSATNTWRRVTDGVYVYSAYWDDRPGHRPFVRIVGGATLKSDNLSKLKCIMSSRTSRHLYHSEVQASYEVLTENHSKPSIAVYIKCIPKNGHQPVAVSVVHESWNSTRTNRLSWLRVQYSRGVKDPTGISVCVRPLFNYRDTFRISEFVAFYEALGVNRFTFYDYSASPVVGELIRELQSRNYSIELLPWNLPHQIEEMWSLGQIASINDCILHHMASSAFVLVVDLDEFVVPRHAETLQQLISVHDVPGKDFSSFVFRSTVFCGEYDPDTLPDVVPDFVTQSRLRRETRIYPFLVRSKYVARPRSVVVAGIHFVWELVKGADQRFVPAGQVLVHHYRSGFCRNDSVSEVDPMARKYLNQLMRSKAVAAWNEHFKGLNATDLKM